MAKKYKEPRITSSKKECKCFETGNKINKFEKVLIDPADGIKIYCKESKKYHEFVEKNAPREKRN